MLVETEILIDGVVHTLLHDVLPGVEARFARGQLYAAVDVLQNLRDRVEPKAELCTTEADSIASALAQVRDGLADAGHVEAASRVSEAVQAVPAGPPQQRVAAMREALVAAIGELDVLPAEGLDAARAAIGAHLGVQAMRDVATLKPSLLSEISKGS